MNSQKNPPPLRDAATIILVREKNKALEVYLLKRNDASKFMGGLYVFPGGVVEAEDREVDTWTPRIDMTPAQIETRLGGNQFSREEAMGFGVAAIRETLEEAGVLIAANNNKTQEDFDEISCYRLNPDLPNSWFQTKMTADNWTLSFSHLGRWSHWITPKRMKKRFDTRFFIVFMPDNQTCAPDDRETKHGIWLTPQTALEQNLAGKTPLSPPAVVTLTHMSAFTDLTTLKQEIKSRSWGDPIAPRLLSTDSGPVILEPWDPMWEEKSDTNDLETSNLAQKLLPPGAPFSRLWCDKGVWKPIGL
jgi:8-oxo-dGTP pyrophosphatase MutT (NUDIX family)